MNKEIQTFLSNHLNTTEIEFLPIKKGGSDREFFRIRLPDKSSFVLMSYGTEVEENSLWAGINNFLTSIDLFVPRIIAHDAKLRLILMEDLGDVDLCSQATLPWEKRREYYCQALTQIRRLHSFAPEGLPSDLKLAKKYGLGLYFWEHDYFIKNFIEAVCHVELTAAFKKDLAAELSALARAMLQAESCLIHRDLQSQNIMIKNNQPIFIDFQGMRRGNLFYDLGSLICDPYVTFTNAQRNELISFYQKLIPSSLSLDEFQERFWKAAAQRLMQALGAYGFLGLKKNKPDFFKHIDNGIKNLVAATSTGSLPVLNQLAQKCMDQLAAKSH